MTTSATGDLITRGDKPMNYYWGGGGKRWMRRTLLWRLAVKECAIWDCEESAEEWWGGKDRSEKDGNWQTSFISCFLVPHVMLAMMSSSRPRVTLWPTKQKVTLTLWVYYSRRTVGSGWLVNRKVEGRLVVVVVVGSVYGGALMLVCRVTLIRVPWPIRYELWIYRYQAILTREVGEGGGIGREFTL